MAITSLGQGVLAGPELACCKDAFILLPTEVVTHDRHQGIFPHAGLAPCGLDAAFAVEVRIQFGAARGAPCRGCEIVSAVTVLDPVTGAFCAPLQAAMPVSWILDIHTQLYLPHPLGASVCCSQQMCVLDRSWMRMHACAMCVSASGGLHDIALQLHVMGPACQAQHDGQLLTQPASP